MMLKNNGNFTRRKSRNKLRGLRALEATSDQTNAYFYLFLNRSTYILCVQRDISTLKNYTNHSENYTVALLLPME